MMQEVRELINVQDSQGAAQQMTHRVPGGVAEPVYRMQRRQRHAIEFGGDPPIPEPVRIRGKTKRRIPESKMQFES